MNDDSEERYNIIFYLPIPKNIQEATGQIGNKEILRLEPNGDIFVKGKLVENDKAVVEGLRDFLRGARET